MKNTALKFLKKIMTERIDLAIICGSGINISRTDMKLIQKIPYSDIPEFPVLSVKGHKGELLILKRKKKNIAVFSGRIHYYEGYSPWEITFFIRLIKDLGIDRVLITNAAGSVNKDIIPGDVVIVRDFINFCQINPLIGKDMTGERFIDMSDFSDKSMINKMTSVFGKLKYSVKKGVYAYLTGPCYETEAETKMLSILGADIVGMSTVPEIIMAKKLGLKVICLSLCTNFTAGLTNTKSSHNEVVETGRRSKERFDNIFREFIDVL